MCVRRESAIRAICCQERATTTVYGEPVFGYFCRLFHSSVQGQSRQRNLGHQACGVRWAHYTGLTGCWACYRSRRLLDLLQVSQVAGPTSGITGYWACFRPQRLLGLQHALELDGPTTGITACWAYYRPHSLLGLLQASLLSEPPKDLTACWASYRPHSYRPNTGLTTDRIQPGEGSGFCVLQRNSIDWKWGYENC